MPIFVSFSGNIGGRTAFGWIVSECDPLVSGKHVEGLCREIEKQRGYDDGTVVILYFRRLET